MLSSAVGSRIRLEIAIKMRAASDARGDDRLDGGKQHSEQQHTAPGTQEPSADARTSSEIGDEEANPSPVLLRSGNNTYVPEMNNEGEPRLMNTTPPASRTPATTTSRYCNQKNSKRDRDRFEFVRQG